MLDKETLPLFSSLEHLESAAVWDLDAGHKKAWQKRFQTTWDTARKHAPCKNKAALSHVPDAQPIGAIRIGEDADRLEQAQGGLEARLGQVVVGLEVELDGEGGLEFRANPETGECTFNEESLEDMPAWLQKRLTPERLERICERIVADHGKSFGALLLDNIPVALIVLLPFMALVLKGLYPLSRRYFVEHLLFFVHFHAFFFLILTLQILFSRIAGVTFIPQPISVLVVVAASFYIPVYLYKAMRTVYGQGHILTFAKYVALAVAYILGASLTMLGVVLFALFSL